MYGLWYISGKGLIQFYSIPAALNFLTSGAAGFAKEDIFVF